MEHPYLYFTKNDVEKYRKKLKTEPEAKQRYAEAVKNAEEDLKEEFVTEAYANGKKESHGCFWDLKNQTNRLRLSLGTKYLVENDERCLNKLKDLLRHFLSFERWYAESYSCRTPVPWHADLCSTAMTLATSAVYDIIYNDLSAEEKGKFAKRIFELGVKPAFSDWVLPETRIHAVDSMGHNWWAVCIAESATALLALKDNLPKEICDRYFRLADEALAAYFTYKGNLLFNKYGNFDEKGLFYESIGYFEYGTAAPLCYLWCSEKIFGKNEVLRKAINPKIGDALMSFAYPYTKDGKTEYGFLDFGDSQFDSTRATLSKLLKMTGYATPAIESYLSSFRADLWEEIGGFTIDKKENAEIDLSLTSYFPTGIIINRDSWKPDSTLFAVKSGFCWNHSHNDAGSFMIVAKGKPFITDSGTCDYDHKLYHDYYCQGNAHNILRISGNESRHEELYRGTKFPAKIAEYKEGDGFLFVQADCTGPMAHLCSRMYRNFFLFDNRTLVIFDDVYCHEDNTVDFLLHYNGTCEEKENTFFMEDGNNKLAFCSFTEKGMTSSSEIGHEPHKPNEEKPFLVLTTKEKARKHLLIHTLDTDEKYDFTKLYGKNCEGIEGNGRRIWYNHMADGHIMHDNSNNVIDGFDTDAYMLVIEENRILMICGSYLRKDGKELFSSFTKTTVEIKR